MVDARHRAVDNVPGRVPTGFGSREPNRLQAIEYSWKAPGSDPVELHVLAYSNIDEPSAIFAGNFGDHFQLGRRQVSRRYPDPDHEEAILGGALSI
jgi:hypothetical protein